MTTRAQSQIRCCSIGSKCREFQFVLLLAGSRLEGNSGEKTYTSGPGSIDLSSIPNCGTFWRHSPRRLDLSCHLPRSSPSDPATFSRHPKVVHEESLHDLSDGMAPNGRSRNKNWLTFTNMMRNTMVMQNMFTESLNTMRSSFGPVLGGAADKRRA